MSEVSVMLSFFAARCFKVAAESLSARGGGIASGHNITVHQNQPPDQVRLQHRSACADPCA